LTAGTAIAAVSMAAAICLVDYLMFVRGVSLGATRPLIALVVAAAIERIHERLVLRHHVDDIARWTRQWSSLDAMRTDVPVDEQAYWLRVATLARLYMGCTSTIVAEVPQGRSRLKLRVIHGTTPKEIAEKRRDVRRSPYRKPHLTLGPVWHDGFMVGDRTATLLMPLVVGTQLLGFWIVNFPNRELVTEPHMALIKTLAHEIAMAIERRRHASATSRPLGVIDKLLGSGRVSIDLAEVRRSFAAHTKNQQELLTLGESMPFGVFVATLWGEIRYLNTAMKLACKEAGIDVTTNNDSLPDVLCQLTGFHTTEMHQHLRKLVQELEELHLRGRDRMDRVGRDFVLSWLRPIASDAADAEQLILVCAVPRRDHDRRPEGARSLAPLLRALHKPTDDHSVTIPRLKVDLDPGEARPLHALPQRLPAASELEGALAYTARRAPFIPDATLRLCRPEADRDPSEITFVAAGTSSLSARSLPVVADAIANPDLTVPTPFTSFEDDDSH
ncbi:MAG: transrane sensor domain-like protein, partial [Deltaproteobacteria bacterium]|nr:transrane sensor domain-like protein [Deltaproteobacteria bacterium]